MCRSRGIALTILSVVLAPTLVAQTAADRVSRQDEQIRLLTQKRDSLGLLWQDAQALVALQDSLEHVASFGRLDTVAVGAIRIITNGLQDELRVAAERYWPSLDSLYGDAAGALGTRPVLVQVISPDTAKHKVKVERWGVAIPSDATQEDLDRMLRGWLVMPPPDSQLQGWLLGSVHPPFAGLRSEASEAYVALVTATNSAARRCFAGDMAQCRLALWFERGPKLLNLAYQAPQERQKAVKAMENYWLYRRMQPAYQSCLAGDDSTCIGLLDNVPPSVSGQLVAEPARQLLLHLALVIGGRDAYARLIRRPFDPIDSRLAQAAGAPIDQLLERWHAAVIAGRPEPVTPPVREVLVGLGWVAILGCCCLRSSRWRRD